MFFKHIPMRDYFSFEILNNYNNIVYDVVYQF